MRKLFLVLFLFTSLIYISGCEKDDICVDGNTPLLFIEFYNIADTSALKAVPKLRIGGIGHDFTVNTFSDRSDISTVQIPLKTGDTSTSFAFINNSSEDDTGAETGNVDVITFNYSIEEVFISRACGFVVNYNNLAASITPDATEWIQDIIITDTLVKDNAAAHVKIYH